MTKKCSRLTCDNMEDLVYLHEVWPQVRERETVNKMRLERFFVENYLQCLLLSLVCWLWDSIWMIVTLTLARCFSSLFFSLCTYTYTYTYCYYYCILYFLAAPAWVPVKATFSTSDTIVILYRHWSKNWLVSLLPKHFIRLSYLELEWTRENSSDYSPVWMPQDFTTSQYFRALPVWCHWTRCPPRRGALDVCGTAWVSSIFSAFYYTSNFLRILRILLHLKQLSHKTNQYERSENLPFSRNLVTADRKRRGQGGVMWTKDH